MRLPTTLLFNAPSIRPGFLGNLRLVVGLPGCRQLVLRRRAPLVLLVLLRSSRRFLRLLASLARRGRTARVRLPFPHPLEAPAAPGVKEKEPERSLPDRTSLPLRVGGCLALHWRQWQAIGAETWVVIVLRDGYQVPFTDSPPPLSRTPVSFPTYRAVSPRAQALQQDFKAMLANGALEIALDPGPGFYSRLFLVEEAIEVHVGGDGLPVPSPVFRTVDHSPGLHQSLRSCASVGTLSRDQTSPVSGRLVDSCLFGAGSQAGRPVFALALSHPRDCDKREEVRSRALADCEVSWHDHRYRGRQGFSVSGASREIPNCSGELLYHGCSPGTALAGDPRSPGFARAAGPSWSPSDALSAVASQGALVPRVRPSLSSGAIAPGNETGSVLVDGEEPSFDGGPIRDTCSGSSPVFGRVLFGVGCSPSRSTHVRGVVQPEVAAHQSSRDEGSFLGPSVVSRRCHRSSRDNSTVVAYVNKQGGTVSQALCLLASRLLRWTESFDVHLDARYLPGQDNVLADVLSRRGQVVGTEWSLHPQVARSLLRVWGNPSIDLFATCLNAKLPLYCSLVPVPQAVFEGCVSPSMGRPGSLRVPSLSSGRSGGRPCPRVVECRDDSGCTSLAREGVVRRPSASTDPTTSCPALVGQSASAAPLQPLPPRHPRAEPACVATLKRHFRKLGFSGRAAGVLSGCLRSSTSRLY